MINTQKYVVFLYTNNEISEWESKKKKSCLKSHIKKDPALKLMK